MCRTLGDDLARECLETLVGIDSEGMVDEKINLPLQHKTELKVCHLDKKVTLILKI